MTNKIKILLVPPAFSVVTVEKTWLNRTNLLMEPNIFGSLLSWREQIKNMNTKKPRLFTLWLCQWVFFLCVGAFSRKRAVKENKSTPSELQCAHLVGMEIPWTWVHDITLIRRCKLLNTWRAVSGKVWVRFHSWTYWGRAKYPTLCVDSPHTSTLVSHMRVIPVRGLGKCDYLSLTPRTVHVTWLTAMLLRPRFVFSGSLHLVESSAYFYMVCCDVWEETLPRMNTKKCNNSGVRK